MAGSIGLDGPLHDLRRLVVAHHPDDQPCGSMGGGGKKSGSQGRPGEQGFHGGRLGVTLTSHVVSLCLLNGEDYGRKFWPGARCFLDKTYGLSPSAVVKVEKQNAQQNNV